MIVVPVFDFVSDAALERTLKAAAVRVLASRRYVLDSEVAAFECEFAAYCGTSECVGVANGTDALELALRAVGVDSGDRVATVANAGYYTCAALAAIGAEPVFVDVDDTLTMAPASLERAMSGLKAIVVTHLYGRLAAIESIVAVADREKVAVVEDCAHAPGAAHGGRRAGSFGTAGCFSFYPTKNLGAVGDAGAIVTSSTDVSSRLRVLRQYGWTAKYRVEQRGGRNSRLDELQAAFLRVKLPRLADWNAERLTIARRYCDGLDGLGLVLPDCDEDEYVGHLFVIQAPERDALRTHLAADGIATDVHYPIPDFRQPAHGALPLARLPRTERACSEVVTLPCYPGMSMTNVDRVIRSLHRHYQ